VLGSLALFAFSRFTLASGPWDFFWPQFLQGAAMAFVFVPLTTVTMDPIPLAEMGNATALFNLMRNIGGSVGIAFVTTLLARRQQFHQMRLGDHLTASTPGVQQMLAAMRARFMAQGADLVTATHRALAALYGLLQQQAYLLSFVDNFWLLAVVFLVMAPLVLLMRKPRTGGGPMSMH